MTARLRALGLACLWLALSACGGGTDPAPEALPQVTLTVSNGDRVDGELVITLEAAKAPLTTANFLAYVNAGFYDNTVFNARSNGSVGAATLIGGQYEAPMLPNDGHLPPPVPKPAMPPVDLEDDRGLSNRRLTLALMHGPDPGSATSGFWINLADNTEFDRSGDRRGFAVFGTLTGGFDVLAAIESAPCVPSADASRYACLPWPNIVIVRARRTR